MAALSPVMTQPLPAQQQHQGDALWQQDAERLQQQVYSMLYFTDCSCSFLL